MTIDVKFNDSGRTAESPPNPKFPRGMAVSVAKPGEKSCTFNLPYGAARRDLFGRLPGLSLHRAGLGRRPFRRSARVDDSLQG